MHFEARLEATCRPSTALWAPKSREGCVQPAGDLRGSALTGSGSRPRSEELGSELSTCRRAPKSSTAGQRELSTTPPWKRLTTSDPRASSEELSLKLPAGHRAPKGTEVDRRETAPRLLRNRCRPVARRHTPKGATSHQGAPPGPSWDPSPSSSTPRRSEDRLGASRYVGDPKTTSPPRELASEPQDPVASTIHAATPRRTTKRRREVRRDPADRAARRLARNPTTPKDHRTSSPLASQPLELINTDHSPRSAPPKRLDAPSETSSELHGTALA